MDKKQMMSMVLKLKSELSKLESMIMDGEADDDMEMEEVGEADGEIEEASEEMAPKSNKKAGIVAMLKKKASNL